MVYLVGVQTEIFTAWQIFNANAGTGIFQIKTCK
jgi:hypothetical protein